MRCLDEREEKEMERVTHLRQQHWWEIEDYSTWVTIEFVVKLVDTRQVMQVRRVMPNRATTAFVDAWRMRECALHELGWSILGMVVGCDGGGSVVEIVPQPVIAWRVKVMMQMRVKPRGKLMVDSMRHEHHQMETRKEKRTDMASFHHLGDE